MRVAILIPLMLWVGLCDGVKKKRAAVKAVSIDTQDFVSKVQTLNEVVSQQSYDAKTSGPYFEHYLASFGGSERVGVKLNDVPIHHEAFLGELSR